jgi:hypothetical protein
MQIGSEKHASAPQKHRTENCVTKSERNFNGIPLEVGMKMPRKLLQNKVLVNSINVSIVNSNHFLLSIVCSLLHASMVFAVQRGKIFGRKQRKSRGVAAERNCFAISMFIWQNKTTKRANYHQQRCVWKRSGELSLYAVKATYSEISCFCMLHDG